MTNRKKKKNIYIQHSLHYAYIIKAIFFFLQLSYEHLVNNKTRLTITTISIYILFFFLQFLRGPGRIIKF